MTDCDVSQSGSAPEHGICQSLGYERAVVVNWGYGEGENDDPMPHAYNWSCVDFVCGPSGNTSSADNCSASEMLDTIVCEMTLIEECDDGNTIDDDECSNDCALPE